MEYGVHGWSGLTARNPPNSNRMSNGMLDAISAFHDLLTNDQLAADSHATHSAPRTRAG